MPESKTAPRFDAVPESAMTQAHRDAIAEFMKTPRGSMAGPFAPMLHSPEFFDRAQRLGEYLRFAGAVPKKLREFAILIAARHWSQTYEWHIHAPIAANEGLGDSVLDELAQAKRPARMDEHETVIYEFCTQVHRNHGVDDATYAAALKMLGTPGIVDLCGICGYYSMLAMVMNVARTQLPEGATAAF